MRGSLATLPLLATVWAQPYHIPSSSSTFYFEMAAIQTILSGIQMGLVFECLVFGCSLCLKIQEISILFG